MTASDSEPPGASGAHPRFSLPPGGHSCGGRAGRRGAGANDKGDPPRERPRDKLLSGVRRAALGEGVSSPSVPRRPPTRFRTDLSKVSAVPSLREARNGPQGAQTPVGAARRGGRPRAGPASRTPGAGGGHSRPRSHSPYPDRTRPANECQVLGCTGTREGGPRPGGNVFPAGPGPGPAWEARLARPRERGPEGAEAAPASARPLRRASRPGFTVLLGKLTDE
nr:translation initiation factor IF-2-like [Saimiri boliviensis boliviensis]